MMYGTVPLAYNLLQQLPTAVMSLSNLQVLVAQHGSRALQLQLELLPWYSALSEHSGGSIDMEDSNTKRPASYQGVVQLKQVQAVQMAFKLQQIQLSSGWCKPSYTVLLQEQLVTRPAGVHDAVCYDTNDEGQAAVQNARDSSIGDFASARVLDNAADTLLRLMPENVHSHLLPYLSLSIPGQPLVVQIMADAGSNIQLRLSDHTIVELPCVVDIPEALARISAVGQGLSLAPQQQQHEAQHNNSCDACSDHQTLEHHSGQQPPASAAHEPDWSAVFASHGNRYRIPGTLHQVSALCDIHGKVFGLTYHIGRCIPGIALMLADVLSSMKASIRQQPAGIPQNLLMLGAPGSGKKTLLRDIARFMSLSPSQGSLGLAVAIVSSTGDITGGDVYQRQPGAGAARPVLVPQHVQQSAVLLDVLHNHKPDVIIVDGTSSVEELETVIHAARKHSVLLVVAAASANLQELCGDEQAAKLCNAIPAMLHTVLELEGHDRWRLHFNAADSTAKALHSLAAAETQHQQHMQPSTQLRVRDPTTGCMVVQFSTPAAAQHALDISNTVSKAAMRSNGHARRLQALLAPGVTAPMQQK